MPNKNKLQSRSKAATTSISDRENFLRSHPDARKIQEQSIGEICKRFGAARKKSIKWGELTIEVLNDWRELGIFINTFLKELPGGQMTLDFWQQFKDLFVDGHGIPITIDQLKIVSRLASNLDAPVSDAAIALSYRKEIQLAAGFWLEMQREAGAPQEKNFYLELLQVLSPKKLLPALTSIGERSEMGGHSQLGR